MADIYNNWTEEFNREFKELTWQCRRISELEDRTLESTWSKKQEMVGEGGGVWLKKAK